MAQLGQDATSTSTTVTVVNQDQGLVIHLQPQNEPHVRWASDTVDNEFMGKKKSKCCCIYKKKTKWDESSDEDSDCETGHCRGHVEKKQHPESSGEKS